VDVAIDGIAEGLREELRSISPGRSVKHPLSGGWDSRLLLTLLAGRDGPLKAWTTNTGWGHDDDERLAAPVADRLGVPWELVPAETGGLSRDFREAVYLQEYQSTPHAWMTRLVHRLRREPGAIVDGIVGGILIRGMFITPEVCDPSNREGVASLLWRKFLKPGSRGGGLLRPKAWDELEATARSEYEGAVAPFEGHASGPSLAILWTRTRRWVSSAPLAHFGSAADSVSMPFARDAVARAALSVPLGEKVDGALYRRLWEIVSPEIGALPSTHDYGRELGRGRTPRLHDSKAARRGYVKLLRRHPLRPLFSRRLRQALRDEDLRRFGGSMRSVWRLQSLAMFALWHERYEGRLRPFDLPITTSDDRR
jgi:hypothetical protein